MEVFLERWDDSLAIRIPHEIEQKLELTEEDKIEISFDDSRLVVTLADKLPTTFEELWGDYTPTEIELGDR